MSHHFAETRYYVLDNTMGDDFYGCPLCYFNTSEEAIQYSESLREKGRTTVVEEVTWLNETHRSHSIIFNSQYVV